MYVSLWIAGLKRYFYSRVDTVLYFVFTSILTGLWREARCNLATLDVIVAEKRYELRFLGIWVRIRFICFSKSIERRRSASSRTRNLSFFRLNPLVLAIWSASLPGVPTITWGFFDKAIAYETISRPPTRTAVRSPINAPSASKCSAI